MNPANPIRCVVFDFDGTLVDSNRLKREAWFEVLGSQGCSRDEITRLLEQNPLSDRFELIARMLTEGETKEISTTLISQLAGQYNDICESGQATCPEIPGASAMLQTLSQSMPLYLNSATPEEPLRRIVARRAWSGYFQGIYGRPDEKIAILNRILRQEDLLPTNIAMVGDGLADWQAAEAVGCIFISVGDWSNRPNISNRDVRDLHKLPSVILNPKNL